MAIISTITTKGQTTVPAEIRAALDLAPGDRLRYLRQPDGRIVLEKDTASFNDLRGIIKIGRPVSMDEIIDAVAQARNDIGTQRARVEE